MKNATLTGLLAIALTVPFVACDEEVTPTGDIRITYQIGSGRVNCEDAGIELIQAFLMTSADPTSSIMDETVTCDPDDQSIEFSDVEAGRYFIRVEGLDSDNQTIYLGQSDSAESVTGNRTNEFNIGIIELQPAMEIWFDFDEAGNCDFHEVAEIALVIYQNGSRPIESVSADPSPCQARLDTPLLVENLEREPTTYDVIVRGLNTNGEYTHFFDAFEVVVPAGEPIRVVAELESCDGLCDAP